MTGQGDADLLTLFRLIADGRTDTAGAMLTRDPGMANAALSEGATRQNPGLWYRGDTALHIAAASHQPDLVAQLLALKADARARNRRSATPLHAAAGGQPGQPDFSPTAQVAVISALITAGADVEAANMDGTRPLHRAVRCRCAAAVEALIAAGADPRALNGRGTSPLRLTEVDSGRSGAGSPEARSGQVRLRTILQQSQGQKP